ncbi:MAG: rod shape-determining protein MreD [Acidimicrobiales bacterium]|nr:rod shape-determining protein MreD [Acidimicrobiales bacterium]MCB9372891.1 rod shape-determining protein MreD [Microthrixaceae bacterium]
MTSFTGARTALVVVLAVMLQVSLFARTPVFGAVPDVVLLTAIGVGLAGGPDRGALAGFAGGLAFDVFVTTPFGLSALVAAGTGYVVGGLQHAVLGSTWWTPLAVAGIASAAGTLVYGLLGALVGNLDWLDLHTVVVALVVGATNTVLAVVVLPVTRWSQGESLGLDRLRVPAALSRRGARTRRRPPRRGW